MRTSLRHVGIVVDNLEIWFEFLQDLLHFQVMVDQVETGDFISKLLGIPNVTVRTVKLMDENNGIIELLKFINPDSATVNDKRISPNSRGITHIAITVDSIVSVMSGTKKMGFEPVYEPQISPDGKVLVCYLRGPESILFEFVEVLT